MSAPFVTAEPDATIGILGGGQLGRMLALAAARLGFKCHVFSPNPDSPAFDVVHRVTCADYTDTEALDRFAGAVDLVTYEFENVPAECATFLAARVAVLPDPKILATTQDRLAEKNFVGALGIGTAPFADIGEPAALKAALRIVSIAVAARCYLNSAIAFDRVCRTPYNSGMPTKHHASASLIGDVAA